MLVISTCFCLMIHFTCAQVFETNIPLNSVVNHDVIIYENEMSNEMFANILSHSSVSIEKFNDTSKAADDIEKYLESGYNGTWLVLIGKCSTSYKIIPHLNGSYVRFSYKDHVIAAMNLVI